MNSRLEEYKQKIIERLKWEDVYSGIENKSANDGEWITGLCPFHQDTNPSFSFNKSTLQWVCFAECGKGDVFDFIMNTSGNNFKDTLFDLGDRYNIPRPKCSENRPPICEDKIKEWQSYLNINQEGKRYLIEERGLTEETIQRYSIGWDSKRQRYTIPVRDENGRVVNVRLYSKRQEPKMINYTEGKWKYGSPARLYGLDELVGSSSTQVIICEGEWDRLLLQQEGFVAVTSTHGCTTFRQEWVSYFKSKDVVFIFDCDEEGKKASLNIINNLFRESEVNSVKNIILPLKGTKDENDITDYFTSSGCDRGDLSDLINRQDLFVFQSKDEEQQIVRLTSFTEIEKDEYIDKRVQCDITVCGETSEAFHAVEEFEVTHCPKMKSGDCLNCVHDITVPTGAQEYIGSCMSSNNQVIAMLRAYCCEYGQRPTIKIIKKRTVKEFFCHQRINRLVITQNACDESMTYLDGRQEELVEKRVYYLSPTTVKPGHYLATGYIKSHPKTQQITFLIEHLEPQEDDYQAFSVQSNIDHLKKLKQLHYRDILSDLTTNVTRIYDRDEILIATLLTYLSPLHIPFNGEIINGWMNTLIIGDAGTGKTQTVNNFSQFVKVGDWFSGLTGSRTGLAYALVEHAQKGWQVKIGRYPANSGKLLIIDEAQYIPERDMRSLCKAQEDGIMVVDRVSSGGFESKTRMIRICNPKNGAKMNTYVHGCEALKDLYDDAIIRRIDLAIFLTNSDLNNIDKINRRQDMKLPGQQLITPEMMRALIYLVWNLKPHQIVFEDSAVVKCLEHATELSKLFGFAEEVPLALPESFRKKLAKISTATAALMMSFNDNFTQLTVTEDHVTLASGLIKVIYASQGCALNNFSEIQSKYNRLMDYEEIKEAFLDKQYKERFKDEAYFSSIISVIREKNQIKRIDLSEMVGCTPKTVERVVSFLRRYSFIDSDKDGYKKTPRFNMFIRQFQAGNPEFFSNHTMRDK